MTISTSMKGLAAASATAALVVGGAGLASAQNVIPGDDTDGRTVIVSPGGMDIDIVSVDRVAGQVTVSLTNGTGQTMRCEAPSEDEDARYGGTVTTAEVVDMSNQFYSSYQDTRYEEVVHGSVGNIVSLWPLGQLIPTGSVTQFLSDRVQFEGQIAQAHQQAKQDGLVGTTAAFTINNGQTIERSVQLGQPAVSPRGDSLLGFFTICGAGGTQGSQQLYAWSAFEEGWPPADDGEGDTGSLAAGSLGSSDDADGSLGTGSLGSSGDDGGAADNGDGDNDEGAGDDGGDDEADNSDGGDGGEG